MNVSKVSFTAQPFNRDDAKNLYNALKNNKVIAVDVDTQDDFMHSHEDSRDGLAVSGAEGIIGNLKKLTKLMRDFMIPKIETMDSHISDDPEFKVFKAVSDKHCVKVTSGWKKIPETLDDRVSRVVDVDQTIDDTPSPDAIKNFVINGDIIRIEKNTYDLTKNADDEGKFHDASKSLAILDGLSKAGIRLAIVYGVATDFCVKATVDALKKFGIKPIVVEDAVRHVAENGIENPADETYGDVTVISTDKLVDILS